jgi:uncharacterized membrane protein (DUF373 family)
MVGPAHPQRKTPAKRGPRVLHETVEAWPSLGLYERFEHSIAIILSILVSGVIVISIAHLIMAEARDLILKPPLAPVDHTVFQGIFGMIMTVLIAMEFNHTILSILHRQDSIVQLRTVILIALLAMARKFIIIDATALNPLTVFALAGAILALGAVYWLVREQDCRRIAAMSKADDLG